MNDNLFKGLGVEIDLTDERSFGILKETLSRIGIASKKDRTLYQSVHVLQKKNRESGLPNYCLMHFKHLFALDGRPTEITEEDIKRFNSIVYLVSEEWRLCDIKYEDDLEKVEENRMPMSGIKVLTSKEKPEWNLVQKYTIGKNHNFNRGNSSKLVHIDEYPYINKIDENR